MLSFGLSNPVIAASGSKRPIEMCRTLSRPVRCSQDAGGLLAATCLSDIVLRFLRISLYGDDVGSDEAGHISGWSVVDLVSEVGSRDSGKLGQ
jgi:hypothetical protein